MTMAKPNLVEAAEAFSRKYEDVFGDKDPQDIMEELRGCQPAAREPWMEAAMEEIALLYIRSVVTKEQVDGVAVIARHYAQQTAAKDAEIVWLRKERHRHVEALEAAERERDILREALQNYYDECPCRHGAERERCDFCKAAEVALKAQKAPH